MKTRILCVSVNFEIAVALQEFFRAIFGKSLIRDVTIRKQTMESDNVRVQFMASQQDRDAFICLPQYDYIFINTELSKDLMDILVGKTIGKAGRIFKEIPVVFRGWEALYGSVGDTDKT